MTTKISTIKVQVIGAESSGKTFLCQNLLKTNDAVLVTEFLREFVDTHKKIPTKEDYINIFQRQVELEDCATKSEKSLIICDTSPIVLKALYIYYFNHWNESLEQFCHRAYDLTFLTTPDFPWVQDNQRDSDAARHRVHNILEGLIKEYKLSPVTLKGPPTDRLTKVKNILQSKFGIKPQT